MKINNNALAFATIVLATATTAGSSTTTTTTTTTNDQQNQNHRKTYVPPTQEEEGHRTKSTPGERRVWVTYKEGQHDKTLQVLNSFSQPNNLRPASLQSRIKMHYDFQQTNSFVISATDEKIDELMADPDIESIEEDAIRYPQYLPETIRRVTLTSNEEQEIPYGISMVEADKAWRAGVTGAGVKVCVLDTGIDQSHEDFLANNLDGLDDGTGGNEVEEEEEEDDGGWSFPWGGGFDWPWERDNGMDWTVDKVGHGTHVSGTIAACDNGIGVIGVAPDAEIYTVKVFSDNGLFAYSSGIVDAVYKCKEAGANIASLSLGGPIPTFGEIRAYEKLLEEGVLTIAAAGNNGSGRKSFPASYKGVVSVAALDKDQELATFSQKNDRVDISAPGVDVLSTFPMDGDCSICQDLGSVQAYGTISGTSMATPHVSGVAALLWSFKPDASAMEILDALLTSAKDLGTAGRDDNFGNGLVQASAALRTLNGGRPLVSESQTETEDNLEADDTDAEDEGTDVSEEQSTNVSCPSVGDIFFELVLRTDLAADETYWEVARSGDGFPVLAGAGLEDDQTYTVAECLPVDCYTFTIMDSSNDGICCDNGEGSLSVSVGGKELLSAGSFETYETFTFGEGCTGA